MIGLEACTWNVDDPDSFPMHVWDGEAAIGEIAFDGNCDLIVGGGEQLPPPGYVGPGYAEGLYRVKNDGSVSVAVPAGDLPVGAVTVDGITYWPPDGRIYFSVGIDEMPTQILAVDDQNVLEHIVDVDYAISSLTAAPQGGEYGDRLIAVSYAPAQVLAIDPELGTIEELLNSAPAQGTLFSVATFGPDGTLYVAEYSAGRVSTLTDGVLTPFYPEDPNATGVLPKIDGLALSPDGASMFVAYMSNYQGYIDEISVADRVLTPGTTFEINGGLAATGIAVDAAGNVLYEMPFEGMAAMIDVL